MTYKNNGYESPIAMREVSKSISDELDKQIYRAIQEYDIHVDKEELVKALQYDRDQYQKGYKDATRWIPISERLPEPFKTVLVTAKMPSDTEWLVYEGALSGNSYKLYGVDNDCDYKVIAWMPLPEPYKESDAKKTNRYMVCGKCKHYLGGGDWGLDCNKDYYKLTEAMSTACADFEGKLVEESEEE